MSVSFDSVDDVITCGTSNNLIPYNSSQSVSMWIFPFTYGTTTNRRFVQRGGVDFTTRTVSGLGFHCDGATNIFRRSASNVVTTGTWQHISYTWTGTTVATEAIIYVNGATISYTVSQNGATLNENTGRPLCIGASSTGANCFTGYISEVAIWNTVLTANEISILAAGRVRGLPLRVATANLIAYWPLDDISNGSSGDGATFRDVFGTNTGTGNDGANNTGLTGTIGEPLSYLAHVDKNRGIGRGLLHGGIS